MMTAIVFMGSTSLPIVAESVRAWRIFGTKPGNNHGPGDVFRATYGFPATQLQPERVPREAAKPFGQIGLVMTSQKPKRTAINATLNNSRVFISSLCPWRGISHGGGRGASRPCSVAVLRRIDLAQIL